MGGRFEAKLKTDEPRRPRRRGRPDWPCGGGGRPRSRADGRLEMPSRVPCSGRRFFFSKKGQKDTELLWCGANTEFQFRNGMRHGTVSGALALTPSASRGLSHATPLYVTYYMYSTYRHCTHASYCTVLHSARPAENAQTRRRSRDHSRCPRRVPCAVRACACVRLWNMHVKD